ncbi:Dihydropterin pyrophosphokinase [Klebsormidium nitens]|uniref:Dihydropterin pyrophosphokinase n=1 Tax=Klebsormidium nitens TaxID=105231 RepID=A0A1Y1IB64_KLENI|nr:Dihydropterin pyrophosphokinase [Klebsormidium nitens]|eukprot:GAQ88205.1 Dihydropterin pyrophosphokinase [Klebsormidium nitens]
MSSAASEREGKDFGEVPVSIAIGGNIGDRLGNLHNGLQLMRAAGIKTVWTSNLYESAPAYVTDQPAFLNGVVEVRTGLAPLELLKTLKRVEAELGRDFGGQRFGPRPLDLDILYYGRGANEVVMKTEVLEIPHPRISERGFVLQPLLDVLSKDSDRHGVSDKVRKMVAEGGTNPYAEKGTPPRLFEGIPPGLERVVPLNGELRNPAKRVLIMGILNVTPDSFSDGGRYDDTEAAVSRARKMAEEGADIIDVGGQSTRPGATRLTTEEELARVVPVIQRLAADPERLHGACLSIDTFDSKVARATVEAGAHMVNDVSGGALDPDMYSTVADLRVPYVLMHMRGDPTNMQSKSNTTYSDVTADVARELMPRIRAAMEAGVPAWNLILDPGVGFSKKGATNCQLIRDIPKLRRELAESGVYGLADLPILIGPSRKKFLGDITRVKTPEERDVATAAAVAVAMERGANIVRVHNVALIKQAIQVIETIKSPS